MHILYIFLSCFFKNILSHILLITVISENYRKLEPVYSLSMSKHTNAAGDQLITSSRVHMVEFSTVF